MRRKGGEEGGKASLPVVCTTSCLLVPNPTGIYTYAEKQKCFRACVGLVGCCSEWANNFATTDNKNSCMQLSHGQFFFLLSVLIMLVVCVCEDVW